MKITYVEELETRVALSRKMYCPNCGSHIYTIHHQLQPEVSSSWWIECDKCHYEGLPGPTRAIGIGRWKQMNL